MMDEGHQKCEECGTSLGNYSRIPVHNEKKLCVACCVKAIDPEGLMTKSGQLCPRCGALLDQKGKAVIGAGQLMCMDCLGKHLAGD